MTLTEKDEFGESLIGLTEKQAIERTKEKDLLFRVTRRDGEFMIVTMDLNPDRLNFHIREGVVVQYQDAG